MDAIAEEVIENGHGPVVDAETLPDIATPSMQVLLGLDGNEVLRRAPLAWAMLKQSEWYVAVLFHRIAAEKLYGQYGSLTAWARHVLGKKSSGEVAKLREQGQWLIEGVPPGEQAEVVRMSSPKCLAEAGIHRLSKVDAAEAITLAKSGKTQKELRDAVHARLAGRLHLDSGEFRNLHREKITKEAYREFVEAENLIAFNCQTAHPSISEIITWIAAEVKTGFPMEAKAMLRVGQAIASWRLPAGPAPTDSVEVLSAAGERAILDGVVRCVECKATGWARIEWHHSHSKSLGGETSPQVPLCRTDHDAVKESIERGGTIGHIEVWMQRSDMAWFRPAFEAYLEQRGRTLETLG